MSSSISHSSFPVSSDFYDQNEVREEVKKIWPTEELARLSAERVKHIQEDLTPRLDKVERQLGKIGEVIKKVTETVLEIKNADEIFLKWEEKMKSRISNMLEPSEEYKKLSQQNKHDLIAIISALVTGTLLIVGAIVLSACLL